MEARRFSMKEALDLLGIAPPKVSKDQTQAEIDVMVSKWKEVTLTEHFKKVRREAHPDLHGGSPEAEQRFKDVTTAYEEIRSNLQLRKPFVPPSQVMHCRRCNADRIPAAANHCHACGLLYLTDEPRSSCPVCSTSRLPPQAGFCHACGYDYQVPDEFLDRLRHAGFTESDLRGLEVDGTLEFWRKLPPLSSELASEIEGKLLFSRIRRMRPRR